MCDFHSVIIDRNGKIGHKPSNSHSGIARELGWAENTNSRVNFWEAEWDGQGSMPANLVQARLEQPPEAVIEAAKWHYELLAETLRTGTIHKRFQSDDYADVHRRVANNPNTTPETLAVLASDSDRYVRCYVAGKPNTTPETLAALASD